ncbi:MAG: PEPxxWA-CTERM sorting domain-containing protein [Sphingomonadaceae bacterium]
MKLGLILATGIALIAAPAAASFTIGTKTGANCYPFGCSDGNAPGDRYQQAYNAAAFSGGPVLLTSMSFEMVLAMTSPPDLKSGTFQLSLSTWTGAMGTLDETDFDGNLGADNMVVWTGPLSSAFDGTKLSFSIAPFLYDPSMGNLLLDVSVTGGASLDYFTFFAADYLEDGTFNRISNYELNQTNRLWGLVTTFNGGAVVPEPATWGMLIVGFGIVGSMARRRRLSATA